MEIGQRPSCETELFAGAFLGIDVGGSNIDSGNSPTHTSVFPLIII